MRADQGRGHLDGDQLLALAAPHLQDDPAGGAAAEDHLAGCSRCAHEVERLARVARAARVDAPGAPLAVPAGAWAAIAAATGVGGAEGSPRAPSSAAPGDGQPAGDRRVPAPHRVPDPRRAPRPRRVPAFAAAVAGALVGAGALWGAVSGVLDGDGGSVAPGGPAGGAVVTARLAPPDGGPPSGPAPAGSAVVTERSGARELTVEVSDPGAGGQPRGTYREVWLLDDAGGALSLGVLDGERGRYAVPSGVDLGRFAAVDVSTERLDGDPAHSATSVLRGTLA